MTTPGALGQAGFTTRLEWGPAGLARAVADSAVVVVVDVMRFSTITCLICEKGGSAALSDVPADAENLTSNRLHNLEPGGRVKVFSLNGGALARTASALGGPVVLAGALRNAHAAGRYARSVARDGVVTVLAAGEVDPDGSLRPAVEDLLGAGAIIAAAGGDPSPEALVAMAAFSGVEDLEAVLLRCASGRELAGRGATDDVILSAELDVSSVAPLLVDGAFEDAAAS